MESEKRLSIVYVIPSVEISGGIYVACEHAMRLRRRGHTVAFAVMRGTGRRLAWFPACDIPIIGLGEIPRDVDALIATWWETAYAIADIPARAKFFLIQSIEPRFYPAPHSAEAILSSRAYQLDYDFITVARWLENWLRDTYKKEACRVQNQLNPDLFHPVEPLPAELASLPSPKTCLHLKVRSALPTYVQVFWDEGEGFSESHSILFSVASDWNEKFIALPPADFPKRIRIDMGEVADNTVEFSKLCLITNDCMSIDLLHTRHWRKNRDLSSFSMNDTLLSMVTSGNDPFIALTIDRGFKRNLRALAMGKIRILVEGPLEIPFKGVRRALETAMKTGCEVWFVEGKSRRTVLDSFCAHRIFHQVPIDKMKHIYSRCDILLKLSTVESFAYPPLEMMACGGIPVIGDVEGIHEYMVDDYNGFIVAPDDEEQVIRVLTRLINDGDLRERIKKGCRETVAKHSCWDGQIDVLERFLYRKVSGGQKEHDAKGRPFIFSERELVDLYHGFVKYRDGGNASDRRVES